MRAARDPSLTEAQREELADIQLVLKTASHNCGAALIGDELEDALRGALVQTEAALAGLRRINDAVLGPES
jgi:hypothetical protein